MAINREFGRPHLFVTFTANAQWTSIKESINQDVESSMDRPDVVIRWSLVSNCKFTLYNKIIISPQNSPLLKCTSHKVFAQQD